MSREEELSNLIRKLSLENPYITEEQMTRAYEMYVTDERPLSDIAIELAKTSAEILKRQEALRQEYKAQYEQRKFLEISSLYRQNMFKYQTKNYHIREIYQGNNVQSYNATRKVQVSDDQGNIAYGYYKGISSPNEYELLISRIGKTMGIPVAEFSLYLENNQLEGISISGNPNEEMYDFILGYDFVSDNDHVQSKAVEMKNKNIEHPPISKDEIKNYIELFFDGLKREGATPEQLEQIKTDYLSMVLFNVMVDQKDFNYTNFAVLRNKIDGSYQMAPLFDNGNIKDPSREGTIIIGVQNASYKDVLDVLYSDYYEYIQDFSETIATEKDKRDHEEESKITTMIDTINDTISASAAPAYAAKVEERVEEIATREHQKKYEETHTSEPIKYDSSSQLEAMFVDTSTQPNTPAQENSHENQQSNTKGFQKTLGTYPTNQNQSPNNGFTNYQILIITAAVIGLITMIILFIK